MDFDLSWVLWGLPIAFVLGWLASRLDLRQLRIENRQAPKAYFRGLNFLLNEQQDQAIDAFIEAVQNDPDTSELHFALGNLFRRRGEYERAVRVHEHLLSRADLSRADRHRAQHALALDFLKAGLLDRAEEALRKLEGTAFEGQALLALLAIYERSRDWAQASEIARKLEASGHGSFGGRQAHYLCEQAASAAPAEAEQLLREAMKTAPGRGAARHRPGGAAAPGRRRQCRLQDPGAAGALGAGEHPAGGASAHRCGRRERPADRSAGDPARELRTLALARRAGRHRRAGAGPPARSRALREAPGTRAVAGGRLRSGSPVRSSNTSSSTRLVQGALDHAAKPLTRYRCAACGFEAKQHFWQCPGCQAWDSYPARRVEEL